MTDRSWFYESNGQQKGPCSDSQLRELIAAGTVTARTLIWSEGMTDWQKAEDIPGLFAGASGPPMLPRTGGPLAGARGQGGGPISINVGVWELFWRSLLVSVGCLFVIPVPWMVVMYNRWLVSRLQVPQRPDLSFTGRPMELWWFFAAVVLAIGVAIADVSYLNPLMFFLQVLLYWLLLKWFVAHISSNGSPLSIAFRGSFWGYLGYYLLLMISVITIIGWAWVTAAWIRWMCRHIDGTRRSIVFNGTGWQILWRTVVFSILCGFIIPIPWVLAWYTRWYVSQFALVERTA